MPTTLQLQPPNRVSCSGRRVTAGPTVWVALKLLARRRKVAIPQLAARVWGDRAPSDTAVWSLIHRANAVLTELGHPARCYLDDGSVILG